MTGAARAAGCAALALGLLAGAPRAGALPADARLQGVRTWAFAIGGGMLAGDVAARLAGYDLVVVDGAEVAAEQVAALHAGGAVVLAYLSVGTIERGRWWYRRVKPYRLDRWDDWGEWYADVSAPGFRRVLRDRVAPRMLARGVDGLFLDNTDMIESHPAARRGMRRLVRQLSALVRGRGLLLFTQNGEDSIGPTLPCYDGWNREDLTWTYDFARRRYRPVRPAAAAAGRAAVAQIAADGLLVLATDYTKGGDAAAEAESVTNACAAGALPFVSGIRLARLPAAPLACP